MKKIYLIIVILSVVLNAAAQTETKNHLIKASYHQWKWNDEQCFTKWSVTFENKTKLTIKSVTFRLVIKEEETGTVRYKKTHTVNIALNQFETAPSPYFNLSQELCGLKNIETLEGYYFDAEVLSYK